MGSLRKAFHIHRSINWVTNDDCCDNWKLTLGLNDDDSDDDVDDDDDDDDGILNRVS